MPFKMGIYKHQLLANSIQKSWVSTWESQSLQVLHIFEAFYN